MCSCRDFVYLYNFVFSGVFLIFKIIFVLPTPFLRKGNFLIFEEYDFFFITLFIIVLLTILKVIS